MQGNSHIDGRVMQSPRALHWICIQPIRHHQCSILVGYGAQKANSCVNISNQRRRIVTRRSLIFVCRRGGFFCASDGFVVRIEKQFVTTVLLWTIASWWGILVLVQELLVGTGNLLSWSKSQILQQRPRSHRRPRNAVTQSPALNWHSTHTAPFLDPCVIHVAKFRISSDGLWRGVRWFLFVDAAVPFCASDGFVMTDSIEKQFVTTVLLLILIILYYSKSSMPAFIQFPFFSTQSPCKKNPLLSSIVCRLVFVFCFYLRSSIFPSPQKLRRIRSYSI